MQVVTLDRTGCWTEADDGLTRADLARWVYNPPADVGADAPTVDGDTCAVILAHALGWPMIAVSPVAQVGRFVLVEYQPIAGRDPAAIIAVTQGARYNRAVSAFLAARREGALDGGRLVDPAGWYRRAHEAGRAVLSALWTMQPARSEVVFVARWVALSVAYGQGVADGIGGGV